MNYCNCPNCRTDNCPNAEEPEGNNNMNKFRVRVFRPDILLKNFEDHKMESNESLKSIVRRLSQEGFSYGLDTWIMPGAILEIVQIYEE